MTLPPRGYVQEDHAHDGHINFLIWIEMLLGLVISNIGGIFFYTINGVNQPRTLKSFSCRLVYFISDSSYKIY